MRAPPASYRPMIGARAFIAMSWIFTIFCACVSDSEPPNTVKSLAKTKVLRPLTVPQPGTTPSPGTLLFAIPNWVKKQQGPGRRRRHRDLVVFHPELGRKQQG